jgi:hypothetical protein
MPPRKLHEDPSTHIHRGPMQINYEIDGPIPITGRSPSKILWEFLDPFPFLEMQACVY